MAIADLFPDAKGVLHLAPANKDELLGTLATEAAQRLGRPVQEILDALQGRERLGSTALGRGIAMPHARLPGPDAKLAILARLDRPIEFDARDGEPVDLVFLVLWPEDASEGFLPALSGICRALRDTHFPRQLRQAKSAEEALLLLREADTPHAA
ncbi:PTS sugar transporter subunit IIA [Plastoroseomonas hellenica]|uniref:PTS transporter subunit EIIA n=1 Tax=Plastoroseomonas hellenica TaxID=2687306 RepID=A0ABS5F0L7_9PROT|nr:PTS sugar transporter subunit IIA [Plastoroseomonas hellenica]MBR0645618.1 PTS transporter subunit EIIA [Plastoroseomonas hellenica]MBR0666092.1 PTS transporter subunit EIIA [Plastoroseomonas hellenica]